MRVLFPILLFLSFLLPGCSADDDSSAPPPNVALPTDLVTFKVNGVEIPLYRDYMDDIQVGQFYNNLVSGVRLSDRKFYLTASFQGKTLNVAFSASEKFISMGIATGGSFSGNEQYWVDYKNYPHFTSHYIDTEIHHDVANQKVSANFSGLLHSVANDLQSESMFVELEIKEQPYEINTSPILTDEVTAKVNGVTWDGVTRVNNAYISDDPYKLALEVSDITYGNYSFSPGSTGNRMVLYKFNTETLTYDAFETTGTFSLQQRYMPSPTSYMHVGTFSLTAVNPANPAEVVQVTDGNFRWTLSN